MSATANCPTCHAELRRTADERFDAWVCADGHGLAATLSEVHERAQEDELSELWQQARTGAAGDRPCPMCALPMVAVAGRYDADEALEGQSGDGGEQGQVPVDVCAVDQVIWFDAGELDRFPADRPDAAPTAKAVAALERIRREFSNGITAGAQDRAGITDQLAGRMLSSWSTTRYLVRR